MKYHIFCKNINTSCSVKKYSNTVFLANVEQMNILLRMIDLLTHLLIDLPHMGNIDETTITYHYSLSSQDILLIFITKTIIFRKSV